MKTMVEALCRRLSVSPEISSLSLQMEEILHLFIINNPVILHISMGQHGLHPAVQCFLTSRSTSMPRKIKK